MRFHRHVWRLHHKVDVQVARICRHDHGGGLSECDASLIERAIVQLQVEWEQFVRTFVFDCATGRFEDRSGSIISGLLPRPANRERASNMLINSYRKRKLEPDWYRPDQAIQAADRLRLSNFNTIFERTGHNAVVARRSSSFKPKFQRANLSLIRLPVLSYWHS